MKFISYTFTALAGLCFMSGMLLLNNEGDVKHGTTRNFFGMD